MVTQVANTVIEGQHASLLTGPMLFGYIFDALLFGVLSVQTYIYFLAFPKDAPMLKSIAFGIYTIVLVQTLLAMRDLYILACVGPNNGDAFYTAPGDFRAFGLTWFNITFSTSIVAFVVQWLYAYRIYILYRKMIVAGAILCLSTLQLIIGLWGSMTFIRISSAHRFERSEIIATDAGYDANVLAWGPIHVICDSLIALYMTHPLITGRRRESLPGARHSHLTRLIQFFVETGLLTTTIAIIYTAASAERNAPLYTLSGLPLGKLYGISMMVILNDRLTIKDGRNVGDLTTLDAPAEFCIVRDQQRKERLKSAQRDLEAGEDLNSKLGDEPHSRGRSSMDSEKTVLGVEVAVLHAKQARS